MTTLEHTIDGQDLWRLGFHHASEPAGFSSAIAPLETFRLTSDPLKVMLPQSSAVEKVRDIVSLYPMPPARALVLCVDESETREALNQIQALVRKQPRFPLRPGQTMRRAHDGKRHEATSLFATLGVMAGTVIGKCMPPHTCPNSRRLWTSLPSRISC